MNNYNKILKEVNRLKGERDIVFKEIQLKIKEVQETSNELHNHSKHYNHLEILIEKNELELERLEELNITNENL